MSILRITIKEHNKVTHVYAQDFNNRLQDDVVQRVLHGARVTCAYIQADNKDEGVVPAKCQFCSYQSNGLCSYVDGYASHKTASICGR